MGYLLYFCEKWWCNSLGCKFVGRKTNLALLLIATIVVSVAIILDAFPIFHVGSFAAAQCNPSEDSYEK